MKTILVVDDESDVRESMKALLERVNYHVEVAVDGDDCLEKLKTLQRKPDLILLDIMMPGTPVAEVIEKIESILDDVKIVFLSAVRISEIDNQRLSLQENVVDFIQKPFSADELLKIVKKAVGE